MLILKDEGQEPSSKKELNVRVVAYV